MKKFLSTLLAALMLLTILAVPVYAEGPMKFELVITSGPYDHGTDETITAEIRVSNNQPGQLGGNMYIDIPDGLVLSGTPKKVC